MAKTIREGGIKGLCELPSLLSVNSPRGRGTPRVLRTGAKFEVPLQSRYCRAEGSDVILAAVLLLQLVNERCTRLSGRMG